MSSISETAKPIELKFCRNLLLGPRMVVGYNFPDPSTHRFAGNPGKTGFYSSIYITLYYRNNGLNY